MELARRVQRQIYLLTYSRADLCKFPTKDSFADAVIDAWVQNGKQVVQWVVCIEEHKDSESNNSENKFHYHMALKLKDKARWNQVKDFMANKYDVQIHFSDKHALYYSAYKYLLKQDPEPLLSPNHPDLSVEPRTSRAVKSRKRKTSEKRKGAARGSKKRRLSTFDVTQLVMEKGIKSRLELSRLAMVQHREGNSLLAEFIANRGSKAVDEALCLSTEFLEVEQVYDRAQKSRVQLLIERKERPCADSCEGRWLQFAMQIIQGNGIDLKFFCNALYTALSKGRGKYQNVYVHGPANTGKTFILSPLKEIYHCFVNPARGSFAWMGVEKAEIVLLNDFRWHPTTISWCDFLQALEGDIVHFPAPKNFCSKDIEFSKDTPFFATADQPLMLVTNSTIDQTNTEMMRVRWRHFNFWKQIPETEQVRLAPCGRCFATFILDNRE